MAALRSNKFVRFASVGLVTTTICWVLYEILFAWNLVPNFREAFAWAVSYALTSILAHYLHYRVTFDPERSYWPSLWRTLIIYGTSLVVSTFTDHWLAQQMPHRLAWLLNMAAFGLINFFLLRYYAYREPLPKGSRGTQGRSEA
jgi:putative flippase GtrA